MLKTKSPAGQIEGAVFLRAEAGPVGGLDNPRTEAGGNFAGAVAAARIDDDPFVGKGDRAQTVADVAALVVGDDDD